MTWLSKKEWLEQHPNSNNKMRLIAEDLAHVIKPYVKRCEIAGSIRRKKPICQDIDLVVWMDYAYFGSMGMALRRYGVKVDDLGATLRKNAIINVGFKFMGRTGQIFMTHDNRYFGGLFLHRTGSKDFNVFMSTRAKAMGLKLSMYGLTERKTKKFIINNEEGIFKRLKLFVVRPECRSKEWLRNMGWFYLREGEDYEYGYIRDFTTQKDKQNNEKNRKHEDD